MAGVSTQKARLDRSIDDGTTFTLVNCTISLTTPSADRPEQDVTCLDSTAKEYIAGLSDNGEISVSLNFDGADATHQQMLADSLAGTDLTWRVAAIESGGVNFTTMIFNGYAKGFSMDLSVDGIQVMAGSIRVSGPVTTAHGVVIA